MIPILGFRGERRWKELRGIHLSTYTPTLTSGDARTGLVEARFVDFIAPFRPLSSYIACARSTPMWNSVLMIGTTQGQHVVGR